MPKKKTVARALFGAFALNWLVALYVPQAYANAIIAGKTKTAKFWAALFIPRA